MNVIHLSKGQRKKVEFDHPVLKLGKKMNEADILAEFNKDSPDTDKLIMGHLYCVKNIVSRLLAHWPETQRFQEDMVSEGMAALVEAVADFDPNEDGLEEFAAIMFRKIQQAIEVMLNDNRSTFGASRTTNYKRVNNEEEPEYNYAASLREDLDAGRMSDQYDWVDMLDDVEHLTSQDKEYFRELILLFMERNHNLSVEDLTESELEAINQLAKMFGDA